MTNDRDNEEKGNSKEDTVEKESKEGLKRHRTKWETEKINFVNRKRNFLKNIQDGKTEQTQNKKGVIKNKITEKTIPEIFFCYLIIIL